MFRVLIVDDEIIVRIGLISCIKWEDHGYEIVGACESAEEAVEKLEKAKPDIVFTDIKMGEMDGLQLVQHIRQHYPHTKIIVLSCLNEIDYVKKAIKMGAEDYILKLSLTAETLVTLLEDMKERIQNENRSDEAVSGYARGVAFEREQAYQMLISDGAFPEQRKKLLEKLGYSENREGNYLVCCCLVDDYANAAVRNHLSDAYLMKFALLNVLHEFLGKYPFAEAVSIAENECLIVIRFMPETQIAVEIDAYAHRLNDALKTHLNLTVSLGVADSFLQPEQIPQRYEKARNLAALRFFYGTQALITEKTAMFSGTRIPNKNLPKLLKATIEAQDVTALESIQLWFDGIEKEKQFLLPQAVKAAVVEAWVALADYSFSDTVEASKDDDVEDDYFSAFWNAETLDKLQKILLQAITGLIQVITESKNSHPAIAQLKRYLVEHIGESVSLSQAAAHCCLSKTYFCTLFKKETGENFVDYFSHLKMDQARRLLLTENIRVYEAGNAVGITDMSYFNKLFRKYFGVSPSHLKSSCQPEDDTIKS